MLSSVVLHAEGRFCSFSPRHHESFIQMRLWQRCHGLPLIPDRRNKMLHAALSATRGNPVDRPAHRKWTPFQIWHAQRDKIVTFTIIKIKRPFHHVSAFLVTSSYCIAFCKTPPTLYLTNQLTLTDRTQTPPNFHLNNFNHHYKP